MLAFSDEQKEDYYQAGDLLDYQIKYYDNERLHSALNYLRPNADE
jgi:hypothetical protein